MPPVVRQEPGRSFFASANASWHSHEARGIVLFPLRRYAPHMSFVLFPLRRYAPHMKRAEGSGSLGLLAVIFASGEIS